MKSIHIIKSLFIITIFLQSITGNAQEKKLRYEDAMKWCCKSGHECCRIEYIKAGGQKSAEALKLFSGQKTSGPHSPCMSASAIR